MSPTNLLIPTYQHMLQTLSRLLDKAQQQMPDHAETLLSARLAADMFPLATQVRFAAFQAQEAVFRLRGEQVPQWVDSIATEARNAGDAPGLIADAKARLDSALLFLEDMSNDCLDGGAGRSIGSSCPMA